MLLDTPEVCPWFPALALVGIAGCPDATQCLILTLDRLGTPSVRIYVGHDRDQIARRTAVVVAALFDSKDPISLEVGARIAEWVADCWSALEDELVTARAAS